MPIGCKNSSRRISPGCTAQPAGPSFLILTIVFSIPILFLRTRDLSSGRSSYKRSVVIRYLYIVGIAVPPHKAHAELIVDPNAVLAFPVMAQLLQPVAGRNSQILHPHG